jgi:serine/threonine protein kinase
LEVIENLLSFDPSNRLSPQELLRHPIFDKFRDPNLEQPAPSKVYLAEDIQDYRAAIL